MSHPSQLEFVSAVARCNADLVRGARVLEIGSYDVNGSVRAHFGGASEYIGVDLVEGPGVDLIAYGHEVDLPDGSFDITVSCECFEHDPHWVSTWENMIRLTRPGGLVVVTCASRGRPEHGTVRTRAASSPGTQFEGLDYYGNVTVDDVRANLDLAGAFSQWGLGYQRAYFDLYFAGVRAGEAPAGEPAGQLPTLADVQATTAVVPRSRQAISAVLGSLNSALGEQNYQELLHVLRMTKRTIATRAGS